MKQCTLDVVILLDFGPAVKDSGFCCVAHGAAQSPLAQSHSVVNCDSSSAVGPSAGPADQCRRGREIGRASCRERVL